MRDSVMAVKQTGQLSLAEALIGAKPGVSGHLDRLDGLVDWKPFEAAMAQSEQANITLNELKRDVEEVDLADAITKLTGQQTALEAAIGAIGATSHLSLLNFLQ